MPATVPTEAEYQALVARVAALEAGGGSQWGALPCIYDFGAVGDGVADDTAAHNAFMTTLNGSKRRTGYLGSGTFRLTSQPVAPTLGVTLFGDSPSSSVILRDYNGSAGVGVINIRENSVNLRSLMVKSAVGRTGGSAVSIRSTATYAASFTSLEDVVLTSDALNGWDNTLDIDGSLKTTAPSGARDISLRNVTVFGAAGFAARFASVKGLSWHGGAIFPASGNNAASGGLQITGTTANRSEIVRLDVWAANGVNLTHCDDVMLQIARIGAINGVSINNDTSANDCRVVGEITGTQLGNWSGASSYSRW